MKKRVIAVVFGLSLLAFAGAGQPQTLIFEVQVPFPSVVGNQTLPAGAYQVERLLRRPVEADQVGMIVIRSIDPRLYKAVVTNLVRRSPGSRSSSRLVFANHDGRRYQSRRKAPAFRRGEYQLSGVRIEGEKGHQIPNAAHESELVGSDAPQEEVVLAELR
jgi:hypothetical protein